MNETDFWLEKPAPPLKDWRAWVLIVPPVMSAVGLFLFGLLGLAFTEVRTIPAAWRYRTVIAASFAVAFGGEIGTASAIIEIFRKAGARQAQSWDWIGLVVSALTSMTVIVLSWAYLLRVDVSWSSAVRELGPLAVGVLTVLDFYISGAEAGLYLAQYDQRLLAWKTDYETELYRRANGELVSSPVEQPPAQPAPQPAQAAGTSTAVLAPEHQCEHCGRSFDTRQALAGHLAHCKKRKEAAE